MPTNRGHESALHRSGKQALARLLASRGFLVLCEHQLADMVAFRPAHGRIRIVCGEHDTRVKTVRRNVCRDFARRCDGLVILVPDERSRQAVRRLLRREFSREIQCRIGVLTYAVCGRQLERLSLGPIFFSSLFPTLWPGPTDLPENLNPITPQ